MNLALLFGGWWPPSSMEASETVQPSLFRPAADVPDDLYRAMEITWTLQAGADEADVTGEVAQYVVAGQSTLYSVVRTNVGRINEVVRRYAIEFDTHEDAVLALAAVNNRAARTLLLDAVARNQE